MILQAFTYIISSRKRIKNYEIMLSFLDGKLHFPGGFN